MSSFLKVKICGVTRVEDAQMCVQAGSDYIGMILTPGLTRSVSKKEARAIARCVNELGAKPIAVFVDEEASEIEEVADDCEIETVQLHGKRSLGALGALKKELKVWARCDVDTVTDQATPLVEMAAVDTIPSFFSPPRTWVLAGRLNAETVHAKLEMLTLLPSCVDLCSGVCSNHPRHKDQKKVDAFMKALTPYRRQA